MMPSNPPIILNPLVPLVPLPQPIIPHLPIVPSQPVIPNPPISPPQSEIHNTDNANSIARSIAPVANSLAQPISPADVIVNQPSQHINIASHQSPSNIISAPQPLSFSNNHNIAASQAASPANVAPPINVASPASHIAPHVNALPQRSTPILEVIPSTANSNKNIPNINILDATTESDSGENGLNGVNVISNGKNNDGEFDGNGKQAMDRHKPLKRPRHKPPATENEEFEEFMATTIEQEATE